MSYHLSPLPGSADTDALGFYVVHESDFGHLSIISDPDPPNDVRRWGSETFAESVAIQNHNQGWPVAGVVRIVEGGNWFKPIDQVIRERIDREQHYANEQVRKKREDQLAMHAHADYADYGSW